ncbi:MAG: hypothetical protein QM737_02375 [Ferruginibacter sp.]
MKYLFFLNFFFYCIVVNAQVVESEPIHASLQFIKKDKKVDAKITLQYRVSSNDPLLIGNLRDYYGYPSLGKFMTELAGSKGTVVSKKNNSDSIYIIPANNEVNFTYTLAYDSATLGDNTYAPNVGEDHVHFAFCQWMLPVADRKKIFEYKIHVDKLPPGWIMYNSITGEAQDIAFKNSLYGYFSFVIGAGIFDKRSYNVHGKPLNIYISGHFDTGNDKIVSLVHKTVVYQHTLFNDFNFRFYSVAILPREGNVAGISISNMFLCHLKKDVSYQKLAWLMSHEMLHRWVGNQVFINDTTSFGLRHQWFKEGINDYLSNLALLDSKLFTKDEFVNSINNYIKNIKENPYADASEDSINKVAEAGKYGVAATKLFYYKGGLMGFIADKAFLKESKAGLHSGVKDLILRLLKNVDSIKLDEKTFFSITDSMKLPLYKLYQDHILNGSADFDLPKTIFAGSYILKKTEYAVYDPGFITMRKDNKLYASAVDISVPAYKAGIRSEMEIISSTANNRFSNAWCDCPIKMVVLINGEKKEIEYMPYGKTVEVLKYVPPGPLKGE